MRNERAAVLDASVLVADAMVDEPFHQDAMDLLVALAERGYLLYLPAIAMPEVEAAIARGLGKPEMALEATTYYRRWPGIQVIAVDELLGDVAIKVAARQRIRGCDAVYVALAQDRRATLITLDREQRERSPANVTARSPRDMLAELSKP